MKYLLVIAFAMVLMYLTVTKAQQAQHLVAEEEWPKFKVKLPKLHKR